MKIDLGSNVVTLTITEEDLIPMLKEYVQQRLGAGTVKVNICLTEPCCVEFTPALQPTQAHQNMMTSVKDALFHVSVPSPNHPQKDVGQRTTMADCLGARLQSEIEAHATPPSSNLFQQDYDGWSKQVTADIPPPPEFPKTRSTRHSSWWSLGANTGLEDGIHPKY